MTPVNKYDIATYDELFDAIENDATDNKHKTAAKLLFSAINDWPTLNEPNDLLIELRNEIKDNLTFDNLNTYLKKLRPENEAWKMEAVTALLEMFDFNTKVNFDKPLELEEIIIKVTQHYRLKE